MRGVRNGAAKEDWHWDLNPGTAALEREGHTVLGEKREDHAALVRLEPRGFGAPFATQLRKLESKM